MLRNYNDILTIPDVMEILRICKSSVYGLLQTNQIRHVKVGRKYIIPKQAILSFLGEPCYNGDDD